MNQRQFIQKHQQIDLKQAHQQPQQALINVEVINTIYVNQNVNLLIIMKIKLI